MTVRERLEVRRAPIGNMHLFSFLLFSYFLFNFSGCEAAGYFGKKIGSLSQLNHGVKGDVYAVDSRTIHFKNFHYDGLAPDAFFYTGTSGSVPHEQGIIIPDENGGLNPLGGCTNKDITLTLPDGLTLKDVPWIAVWCRECAVNFGHVVVPPTFDYPRPQKIDALPTFDHGVSSDKIVVVDAQTFLIPNFHYDGAAPDAFFWTGKGKPDTNGIRVPDENGSLEPLKKYSGKTIVITLPGELTVFDNDYLGVWCRAFFVDFGHVILPKNLNVPPSLKMLGVAPQRLPGYHNLSPSLSSLINDIGPKPPSQPPPLLLHQPGTPLINTDTQKLPKPLPPPSPPPLPPQKTHSFSTHQPPFLNQGARPQIFPKQQSHLLSQKPVSKPILPPTSSQSLFHNLGGRPFSPASHPDSISPGSHRVPLSHNFNQPLSLHPSQNQIGFSQFPSHSPLPASPLTSPFIHKYELKFSIKRNPEKASVVSVPSGIKPISFLSPSVSDVERPVLPPPRLNNVVPASFGSTSLDFPNTLTHNQRLKQNVRVAQGGVPVYFPSFENHNVQRIPNTNHIHSHSSNQGFCLNFPLHGAPVVPQSLKHHPSGRSNSIPNGGGSV